jgi:dihydrolipoamide dehydrogenase
VSDNSFDVIVVGSGPGGYHAAIRAAQLGMNVACVEAEALGGVCLNIGCIPTKALLTSSALVNEMSLAGKHGIAFDNLTVDLGPAQERSRGVADQMSRGISFLFKKNKITAIEGYGRLQGGGRVEVEAKDGTRTVHSAAHVIIATGSRPRDIRVLPIDEEKVWSSTGALFQKQAPASLAVVGAGAVGMEFADIYASYGTKVTVIEALDRALPLEDEECSAAIARSYKKRGITMMLGVRLESSNVTATGVNLTVKDSKGDVHVLEFERALSAVGRVPNTEDAGLAVAGVGVNDQGFVEVDAQLRTNVEGVYAVGDCAGAPLLAHKGMHEGVVCAEFIAGVGHHTVDYNNIPNCTYTHPEVASIGLTEAQAREKGHDIEVGKFPWVGNGRAVAGGHAEGFVKVIRDKKYSEILGAHIIGPSATELIAEYVIGRHLEATVEEMDKAMHPHPTLSEAVAEGALASLGRPIHI